MSDRPQLKDIAVVLSDLKWSEVKSVAVQLGMDLPVLSQIEERYVDLSERTLHSMQAWLQNSSEPSWAMVIAALRAIKMHVVARAIEQQYYQSVETPTTNLASQPPIGPPSPPASELTNHLSPRSPPTLNRDRPILETKQLIHLQGAQPKTAPEPDMDKIKQVCEETSRLHETFLSVLTNVKIYLSEMESESSKILNRLRITLTTLPLSYKFQHLHFLRNEEERIQNAKSVDEIFTILDKHWNWSDYYLLQRLIANFGNDTLKQEMTTYLAELEQFEKATTILLFRSAAKHWDHPYYFSKAVIMLQKDASVCTLYDIRKLKEDLASKSSLNEAAIYYNDVHASLVVVEIVFPQDALEFILPTMNAAFLEQYQIISVTINERPLLAYDEDCVKGLQLQRVCREGDEAVVTSLLRSGVNPNFRSIVGWTALHLASLAGRTAVIALLLDHGADIHAVDEYRRTALHVASEDGTLQLLLDRGANPNALDNLGRTALMRAAEKGHSCLVEVLVHGGTYVNIQDEYDGITALMLATLEGWSETVNILVQCGADLNVQNKEGLTALMVAVKEGQTAIVNILVDGHADVNIWENSTSWTALFFAAKEGYFKIARKLIETGADILLKDQNGVTAVDVARVHGWVELCEMLSKTITPPLPLTTLPLNGCVSATDMNSSMQQPTPPTTEKRRLTFETLRNLVNKSGQRVTEMYRQLERRLKSNTEKELFWRKVAGKCEGTHENTHITAEEHSKIQ